VIRVNVVDGAEPEPWRHEHGAEACRTVPRMTFAEVA
jgi:hypothetical protein